MASSLTNQHSDTLGGYFWKRDEEVVCLNDVRLICAKELELWPVRSMDSGDSEVDLSLR